MESRSSKAALSRRKDVRPPIGFELRVRLPHSHLRCRTAVNKNERSLYSFVFQMSTFAGVFGKPKHLGAENGRCAYRSDEKIFDLFDDIFLLRDGRVEGETAAMTIAT